jgi:hypothetical protein
MTPHQKISRRHNVSRRHKMCRGAALLRPMSAQSIRSRPVAAIVSQIAGFRFNITELDPKGL